MNTGSGLVTVINSHSMDRTRGEPLNRSNLKKLLHILSRNTRNRVMALITRRGTMAANMFKAMLDMEAQNAIIETLTEQGLGVTLISEEGNHVFGSGEYYIIADPVDGTTNLSRGLPPAVLSISVATEPLQSCVVAGIVTNFYMGETYYAEEGKGSTLDGSPIKTAPYVSLQQGIIGMDLSKVAKLETTMSIIRESQHIRQLGCSAASLCHVAEGALDAHVDVRGTIRATDISAGLLIIKEAGGVYSVDGELYGDLHLTRDSGCKLVAANTMRLHDEIMSLMDAP